MKFGEKLDMKEKTIYFSILNFNTAKETSTCISSIRNLEGYNWEKKIILIDNNSTDNSLEILKELYRNDKDVEIYRMEENIGFSKANNYGFNLLKTRMDVGFAVVCNSDVEFVQKDFIWRIQEEFKKSRFYICGPDVFCPGRVNSKYKGHQSPAYPYEWNKSYVKEYYLYNNLKLNRQKNKKNAFFKTFFQYIKWIMLKSILFSAHLTIYRNYRERRHEDLPIHGSCIILSQLFLERESILFYPETKFYWEEVLLYLRAKRNGYKVVYNPEIRINHYQGKATASLNKSQQINMFRNENLVLGAKLYLAELEKDYEG